MSRPSTKGFFVKERLSEARDARGITQADLAKSLQKADSTISNWGRGEQAPEPSSLQQLARVLGVSTSYLQRPMPDYGTSAIFFRSLNNATARVRTREKARVRWLQHTSMTLQEILEFPPVDFPEFVESGGYKKLCDAELEKIAATMRRHWNVGEGPIVSTVLLLENVGVVVGVDEVGSTKIDGQGTWSTADHRPYVLLTRDKYTAFRRQMDAAHELAHLVLHRSVTQPELEQNFQLIEEQAKYLANAFLLPHQAFTADIVSVSLDGFLSLKRRWKVSVGAMIKRAHQLELLNDEAAQRLWINRATRGWHKREPLDLPEETPVEEPRLLRRSIELLVSEKVRSKRDLLEIDIGLGAADIEMLAALPTGFLSEGRADVVRLEPRIKEGRATAAGSVIPFRQSGMITG